MRRALAQVGGALRRLRRVEHRGRGPLAAALPLFPRPLDPRPAGSENAGAVALFLVEGGDDARFSSTIEELDRVLGGGVVAGSAVLVGGTRGSESLPFSSSV